jgi:hypothetical protein
VRYHQQESGEWVAPARKGYRQKCCNCGLVHVIDFALVGRRHRIVFRAKRSGERWPKDLIFQGFR